MNLTLQVPKGRSEQKWLLQFLPINCSVEEVPDVAPSFISRFLLGQPRLLRDEPKYVIFLDESPRTRCLEFSTPDDSRANSSFLKLANRDVNVKEQLFQFDTNDVLISCKTGLGLRIERLDGNPLGRILPWIPNPEHLHVKKSRNGTLMLTSGDMTVYLSCQRNEVTFSDQPETKWVFEPIERARNDRNPEPCPLTEFYRPIIKTRKETLDKLKSARVHTMPSPNMRSP
jgi:hypothetical protein